MLSKNFMLEHPARSYEEFAAHIMDKTNKARNSVGRWIKNPKISSVGCVDELTSKGAVNPPGGGMFLSNEGLLSDFLQARSGQSGQIYIHEFCGYMRVVMGLDSLEAQKEAIFQFEAELDRLQRVYGSNFALITEHNGSAKLYMKD